MTDPYRVSQKPETPKVELDPSLKPYFIYLDIEIENKKTKATTAAYHPEYEMARDKYEAFQYVLTKLKKIHSVVKIKGFMVIGLEDFGWFAPSSASFFPVRLMAFGCFSTRGIILERFTSSDKYAALKKMSDKHEFGHENVVIVTADDLRQVVKNAIENANSE